jgi:hydrogenase expression/formation protein HypC
MCLAIPGKVIRISEQTPFGRTGKVSFGGVTKDVNLSYVPEAAVGDYVLVHAGFAINTIAEQEANQVFEYLREIGEFEDKGTGTA